MRLVGLLFVRSLPTVIFVIILLVILDRFFFRPIAEVTKKRAERTVGALERASARASDAEAKSHQYETALRAARLDIYRERQAEHEEALKQHETALAQARERSERLVEEAQNELALEVSAARHQLATSCRSLAKDIMGKILGPDEGFEA